MVAPQKKRNVTTIRSSNSTASYLSEENKNTNSKRYIHSHVQSIIIYNSQAIETSVHSGMTKENVVFI